MRLVSETRVGAMLAAKRGICHFHVGDGERGLTPLRLLLSETEIPAQMFGGRAGRRGEARQTLRPSLAVAGPRRDLLSPPGAGLSRGFPPVETPARPGHRPAAARGNRLRLPCRARLAPHDIPDLPARDPDVAQHTVIQPRQLVVGCP